MTGAEQTKSQLTAHLAGGEAFVPLEKLLNLIPYDKLGNRPEHLPYSFYEVFYHIWFTQKDIIEYCMSENYSLPNWPRDYWPAENFPKSKDSWNSLKKQYFEERTKFSEHIKNPTTDLLAPLPNGRNHNLLREILLITEHTAYHTGQLVIILRELGVYDKTQNGNTAE